MIGDAVTLEIWTFAEFSVGVIAGSIPPCRGLVVQTLRKMRGEAVPKKNTLGVPRSRSGHGYLFKSFSRITDALSRIRGTPEVSTDLKGSKSTPKRHQPMKPWEREANRAVSQDSGRDIILPLHDMQSASSKEGILRTIDVHVDTGGADSSFSVNQLGQQ